jgi:hypothetical protein
VILIGQLGSLGSLARHATSHDVAHLIWPPSDEGDNVVERAVKRVKPDPAIRAASVLVHEIDEGKVGRSDTTDQAKLGRLRVDRGGQPDEAALGRGLCHLAVFGQCQQTRPTYLMNPPPVSHSSSGT